MVGCHDFLIVLSKIPTLESLHLADFFYREDNFKVAKVRLQHLQQLHVKCAVPEMAQFLPCLVVPRSCNLRIHTANRYDRICDDFRAILSWVSSQLRVPTTSELPISDAGEHEKYIRSFHLNHDADAEDFKVEGFCDVLSHGQLKTDPILKFTVFWNYDDDNFGFNLQTFLSLLPLDGIAFLDVVTDFNVYLSPEFWTVAFGSIQTLKSIYLNTTTSDFWDALTLTNSDNGVVKSLPFSTLASIAMDDYIVEPQLILDKLRVRSKLGGTQLEYLSLPSVDEVEAPPASIMEQLGELVSHIRILERGANGWHDADHSFFEDEF